MTKNKYTVRYEKNAQKALKKMDKQRARLILAWVTKHLEGSVNPRIHGKGLVGDKSGQWRYRVGDYRLIADINESTITILILEIGHRREIYRKRIP